MWEKIGGKAVMKIVSPDILHKTDAGGVALNIESAEAAREAFERLVANGRNYKADANIFGVMLTPMLKGGVECIIGSSWDSTFGPTVMFGLGGIFVEILKDVSFRVAPVNMPSCRRMVRGRAFGAKTRGWLLAGVAAGGLYLTLMLALRGYVSGHWPVSNGYETMRFMAWCTLLLTLLFARRFLFLLPFGYLIAGLSLMVSMMGESNPQITQLMPVLDSPLLCIHVMLVMAAYALLAFVMFGGVAGVVLHRRARGAAAQLQAVSRLMLYPAVFCLAAGIFVGAVWANVSWGRYWGWDPKEVWALVTLLVYALPLHAGSLPWFRRPLFFHWFCIAAFLSVLVTYFGVNFLLGGMHSYAG